jgi:hypothetical protein
LTGYKFIECFALFFIEDRKRQTKAGELLMEPDSAAQGQPTTLRQVNQKANDFANVGRSSGINETSLRAEVLDTAFVPARSAMPLNRKVDVNALISSSLFCHSSSDWSASVLACN